MAFPLSSIVPSLVSAAETPTWYIFCCALYKNNISNSAFTQMLHKALQTWNKLNYCAEDCLSADEISFSKLIYFAVYENVYEILRIS